MLWKHNPTGIEVGKAASDLSTERYGGTTARCEKMERAKYLDWVGQLHRISLELTGTMGRMPLKVESAVILRLSRATLG